MIQMLAFFAIFFGILFLVDYTIARHMEAWFPVMSRRAWVGLISVISLYMLFGTMMTAVSSNSLGQIVFMSAAVIAGIFIFSLLAIAAIDLVGLALPLTPQIKGQIFLILTTALTLYSSFNASHIKVVERDIPIAGLSEPVKVAHVTDVHLGHFRGLRHSEAIVSKLEQIQPDVIFNTGDLFDARIRLDHDVLKPFGRLDMPHYIIEGNHDVHVGTQSVFDLCQEQGMIILENEATEVGEIQLVGLKHMLADENSFDMHASQGATVKSAMEAIDVDPERPVVVLHHSPNGMQYAQQAGADLMLAGHTHGGQIWPLTGIAKLMFKYNNGYYDFNGMPLYVSQGLGTVFSPMRLGTSSELTILNLIPKE